MRFFIVDCFRTNHLRRKVVPVADDSVCKIAPADIRKATLCLDCFTVVLCLRVGLQREEFGVVNITELVQVLEDLYHVSP